METFEEYGTRSPCKEVMRYQSSAKGGVTWNGGFLAVGDYTLCKTMVELPKPGQKPCIIK